MAVHAGNLPLLGGALCLDFANTVEPRAAPQPHDFLATYADLVAWGRHAGLLASQEANRLLQAAADDPRQAAGALRRALGLRETVYRLLAAISQGQPTDPEDLDAFNAALPQALGRLRIVPEAEGFAWDWQPGEPALDRLLWPIVRSTAELLTDGRLGRVKQCGGCGWLFLDESRNRSRRWCDMRVCGNRAKARRHYERQQSRTG